jgi:hypothetical protein
MNHPVRRVRKERTVKFEFTRADCIDLLQVLENEHKYAGERSQYSTDIEFKVKYSNRMLYMSKMRAVLGAELERSKWSI